MLQIRLGAVPSFTKQPITRQVTSIDTIVSPAPTRQSTAFTPAPAPNTEALTIAKGATIQTPTRTVPPDTYGTSETPVTTVTAPDTTVVTSSGMPVDTASSKTATPTDAYACNAYQCRGTGLYDLQFRQLQTLLNQVSGPLDIHTSIQVNGVIDQATMDRFQAIAATGRIPSVVMPVDVPYTPQWLADAANQLILALNAWLGIGWAASSVVSPTATRSSGAGPMVMYVCPDGSKVSDPMMCPVQTVLPTSPDQSPPASGGSDTGPVIVTAPDGSTSVIPPAVVTPGQKFAAAIKKPWAMIALGILGGITLGFVATRNS